MVAFVLFAVVAFGYFILPLVDVTFCDTAAPKPPGYGVRRVIGFAIAAAGVSTLFLSVSTSGMFAYELAGKFHVARGTACR